MIEFKDRIINACKDGTFLNTIYEISLKDKSERENIINELISLNNNSEIDVVAEFLKLKNNNVYGDFFITKRILEKILPEINSPIKNVMECVHHLTKEAGSDMTAGMLFTPFTLFCEKDLARPKEIISLVYETPDAWVDFISPAIVAGYTFDEDWYVNEAIKLSKHENVEVRKGALFSLGRIRYGSNKSLIEKAVSCLEVSGNNESEDQVIVNIVKSSFSIMNEYSLFEARILALMELILSKGRDYSLHAASEIFGLYFKEVSEPLLKILLSHLARVNIDNKGTLDNIDLGISELLKKSNPNEGVEYLEQLLTTFPELSINVFNSVTHTMLDNKQGLLNKVITRWLLNGDAKLCKSISSVFEKVHERKVIVNADENEIPDINLVNLVFISRKMIGYLFMKPVTCCSMIISLMELTDDKETIEVLGSLLFDQILINYTGDALDYLKKNCDSHSGKVKDEIQSRINEINFYLEDLRSIPVIPELHPTQEQQEASMRRFGLLMADSFKTAMKGSIVDLMCTKSVILYGASSINHVYNGKEKIQRMETPMKSHGTSIEMPRQDNLDPFGLDYTLRTFRVERFKT